MQKSFKFTVEIQINASSEVIARTKLYNKLSKNFDTYGSTYHKVISQKEVDFSI